MYAYLKGKLTYKSPTLVYIECGGVGFQVNITLQTYSEIEKLEETILYTQQIVREDGHFLYGFYSEDEKNIFNHLISVSGIGPNTARLMLSSLSVQELTNAIIYEDVRLIQSVKGVGPKSAQRVIIELRDKVKKETYLQSSELGIMANSKSEIFSEAIAALSMLGFAKNQSEKAIQTVLKINPNINTTEDLIKQSLKNL
ncbi:MAG TPA: Holliday junction branch migration protein RuvA [Chitinophagales bacterium]|nr:Holliday junction branch migration protein RuvA [Chitinophagales bacterium]MCB9075434.1 Holliday junction branch migration protein RuvA [Chitinophagales bacterium]HMU98320.1 Holliday junction branch migration protein RuvA [Chitinophagales bacterium]HMV02232.1 Holliday junction branch migration protein RuvA [Chitinophagales bacterium]HMY41569.1 Holliday junction branch migration protein RuvA [Chitinophagales bacterium]